MKKKEGGGRGGAIFECIRIDSTRIVIDNDRSKSLNNRTNGAKLREFWNVSKINLRDYNRDIFQKTFH